MIYLIIIYICYHFTDTTTSTLTRLSAKTVRDILLKFFWLGRMPFGQYKQIQNWPRNKNFSAQKRELKK